ncbi:MAG: HyaD/HybD family hydrogenase maturation endopeptidase [Sedimenticola sp.]
MEEETTLVLGVGNTLLTDEGVGVHVINHLASTHSDYPRVSFVDGGTLSFTLAQLLAENRRLIVVDAARTGDAPGSVVVFEDDEMDRYLTGNRQSVHEVGLVDLLDIARLSDHYPSHRALVGIEPESIDWGEQPSAVVAPAVTTAAEQVMALIRKWDEK